MNALATGGIVFVCVFGGALLGLFMHRLLPDHHTSSDTKDVVKLGMGLLATMAALVLSLLIASAKGSYDTQSREVTQLAANIAIVDRALAYYGPEAKDIRDNLRRSMGLIVEQMWPTDASRRAELDPASTKAEGLYEQLQALSPQTEAQRSLKAEALRVAVEFAQTRSLLFAQRGSSIPLPFLVILIFWVAVIFVSFGLFAPRNATVIVALLVCALSVSCAIFLILELDQPFQGFIQVSSAPLRSALARLGQ